jgi:geranylgeranyl reductase family protein
VQSPNEAFDVTVVGGGPTGAFVALNLAKIGVHTVVFEENPVVGAPSHCAGHLSIKGLARLGLYPLPKSIVENTFSRARFFAYNGFEFSINLKKPVTCAINRQAFDEYLAEKAVAAGADYRLNSYVHSLRTETGFTKGVNIVTQDGKTAAFTSKITIDAEGISSRILKQTGLSTPRNRKIVYAIETEIENTNDLDTDAVEVFLGNDFAPGFYGWLIPRLDGTAKLGLATNKGNPKDYLNRLMLKHPIASRQLKKAKITRTSFHTIPLSGPISHAYANGFLAVGDAASQVKPTTGGGVVFGLTAAKIAAQTASQAITMGDYSSKQLSLYQKICDETLGFDAKVMTRARNFLDKLSDEEIKNAMKFCSTIGLGKSLADVDEIDFQGQTLLKTINKPAVAATLFYFIGLYLSANL